LHFLTVALAAFESEKLQPHKSERVLARQQGKTQNRFAFFTPSSDKLCINIENINELYLLSTDLRGNGGGVGLVLFAPLLSVVPSKAD
jgi:hypothetical protein